MSAALHHAPPRPAARPDFPALRLEDFSAREAPAPDLPDAVALGLARSEGLAEGARLARDRQLEELTAALRQQAEAAAGIVRQQTQHDRRFRAEIAALLRAVAEALLPLGRDARLVAELVGAVAEAETAEEPRLRIRCPAHLHDRVRAACRDAGLTAPPLVGAAEVALQAEGGETRIDLAAMQARILQLIDDYATGEP